MNVVLWGILAYVALQLVIGFVVARRVRTEDDFLLAGRRLGYPLVTLSVFATWFGAETCVGSAGSVYAGGVAKSTADPFGYAVCLTLMGLFFAGTLWSRRLTTLGDLFRQRYSPGVEKMAVGLMVPTSLLWAGAQVRAFGQVLSSSSGTGLTVGVTLAALVAVIYTSMGGLLADAATDFVQGLVLIVGLLVLGGVVLHDVGGWSEAWSKVDSTRASLFDTRAPLLTSLEAWAVPALGSLFSQEVVSRVLAARTPTIARRGVLLAAALYLAVGLIPIFLGLLGPSLLPGLADPEHVLPALAEKYLATLPRVIFVGAIVSAILSTVDSTLLVAASLVSHNVLVPMSRGASEAAKVRWARVLVVLFGAIAWAFALLGDSVTGLVEQASAFGSSGLVVAIVLGLHSRLGGPRAAAAALIVGTVGYATLHYGFGSKVPFLTSLALAAAAFLGTSFAERRAGSSPSEA